MKETYPFKPKAVEVFRVGNKTDMILRKDITQQEKTDDGGKMYIVYECDERQQRVDGVLTAEQVESEFDKWWDYAPPTPAPEPPEKKLEDRVKELEEENVSLMEQVTSTQMALCDVYEQMLAITSM